MKIDGRKLSHAQLEAIRFQAVKAVQAGQPPTAVARALGLYPARVFVWLAAYRAGGWDALRARKASGRPKRLTGSQLRWIYNTVTSKNPLQLQFPFALWTRAMIGTLIRRQYGIKLSAISVGRLLAQMGLSCQKPLSRAFEQDATLVKQWIERDFPKIRALAKKERAVVFFADESGVRSDFHAGTTWGIRGKTPVVRHTGKRFHLNMLSAISAKGELRFMTSRKRLSAALFIEFLRRLITNYPKKIFLVVDGLPAHKAKSVHRFVHQVKDRLRLFFLPPYSPEINPDELVWNDVKNHGVARTLIRAPRDLHRAVSSRLRLLPVSAPDKVSRAAALFQVFPALQSTSRSKAHVLLQHILDDASKLFDGAARKIGRAKQHRQLTYNANARELRARSVSVLVQTFREKLGQPYFTYVASIAQILSGIETDPEYVKKTEQRQRRRVTGDSLPRNS